MHWHSASNVPSQSDNWVEIDVFIELNYRRVAEDELGIGLRLPRTRICLTDITGGGEAERITETETTAGHQGSKTFVIGIKAAEQQQGTRQLIRAAGFKRRPLLVG